LGLPQPLTRRRLWREKGWDSWESANSDEGTYTVVLFIYIYFSFSYQTDKGDKTEGLEMEG
jgi:hypothetical protein